MGKNKNKNYESNLLDRAPVAEEGYKKEDMATVEAPVEVENENLAADPEPVVEAPVQEEKVEKPKKNYGIVEETEPRVYGKVNDKCVRLNVREAADPTAKISAVINSGTGFRIDKSKSTDKFYFISLESGISGFAMKEFIDEV